MHNDAAVLDDIPNDIEPQEYPAIASSSNDGVMLGRVHEDKNGDDECIDKAVDEISVDLLSSSSSKRKRLIHDRPDEWKEIAEYFDLWGRNKTVELYKETFGDRTQRSVDQALKTWSRDLRENNESFRGKRAPAYGFPIDLLLLKEVKERMIAKLPVDDVTLRNLLVNLLQIHERMDLMTDNGGTHLFLHGWAGRFWKRHKLPSRLVPSKKAKVKESDIMIINGNGPGFGLCFGAESESSNLSLSLSLELDDDKPVSAAAHLIALHNAPRTIKAENTSSSTTGLYLNPSAEINCEADRPTDIPQSESTNTHAQNESDSSEEEN